MVRSINEMAHLMGKQTIAEYVENAAIEEQLVQIGIDYAQGYHIEKPIALDTLFSGRAVA
jgi:EAL domain-containing protein (putative c-di-GMP-specific phosphodiesterase class I)